jgi:MFS family permease
MSFLNFASFKGRRDFFGIFAVDLIARWFYQVGKTPLLPLYAAAIGAGEIMIGFIVGVSTFSGIILKPIFGILSDFLGKKVWLFVALVIFTCTPFAYQFVSSEQDLFFLRLFHGISTAILGPVGLAYVVHLNNDTQTKRLAYFGVSRSLASLSAPIAAGMVLTVFDFETVFILIGIGSIFAMVPLFLIRDNSVPSNIINNISWKKIGIAIHDSIFIPAVWMAGLLEMLVYSIVYSLRAFLPLFIISQDNGTILQAGLFFSIQEITHMLCRPIGAQMADKKGYRVTIISGMLLLASGLFLVNVFTGNFLIIIAIFVGAGQGLIFPTSVALLADEVNKTYQGTAMGIYGSLRNIGKVIGPVCAGFALANYDFSLVFTTLASIIVVIATLVMLFWNKIVRMNIFHHLH